MAAGGSGNQQGFKGGSLGGFGGMGSGRNGNNRPGGGITSLLGQSDFQALLARMNGGRPKPAAPAAPTPPWLQQQTVPAATLGGPIPGLQDYMLNLPQYGYFGQPGQVRPQSMMLGGQPPAQPLAMPPTGPRTPPPDWRRAMMLSGF